MCWAVEFLHNGALRVSRFSWRQAVLPVSTRNGAQIVLGRWGRRPDEPGQLPRGGWARRTHLQSDVWEDYAPQPVVLPIASFAERDVAGRERWFQITTGQHIQGCLARVNDEWRVYVVTLDCAPDVSEFERWPRIISRPRR